MRHAHSPISSVVSDRVSQRNATAERIEPMGEPSCGIAAANARLALLSCSVAMRIAPPHSPPSETPCSTRSSTSSTAPTQPAWSNVGSTPMSAVATPIIVIVTMSTVRRPMRSPRWPKMIAPIGRITNATPIVASAARFAPTGPSGSKKSGPAKKAEK